MSGLAKIFLVINLVLTVLFLGTSATLFSVRKDWKTACDKLQAKYQTQFEDQLKTIKTLENKLQAWTNVASVQHAEIMNLRAQNKKLSSELDQSKTEIASLKTQLDASRATIAKQNTQISTLSGKVQSLATTLQEAQKRAEEANKRALAATQKADQNFLQRAQLEEEIVALQEELKKLRQENEEIKIKYEILTKVGPGGVAAPKIEAKIVGVQGDLAVLSVGEESKVQPGMIFAVSRGNKYLGDVKVQTVYKNMSGARIIYLVEGAEIREGDDAVTKQF